MSQLDPLYDDDLDRAPRPPDDRDQPGRTESPRAESWEDARFVNIWTERRRLILRRMRVAAIDLGRENPFLTIWTRPRETIRAIVETDPKRDVVPLAMLAGVASALLRASIRKLGDQVSFSMVLAMVMGLGSLVGFAGLYCVAWVLSLTGRWLGSRARPERLRAAIAWSLVPEVASLPLGVILLAVLGRELFMTRTPTIDAYPALRHLLLAWQVATTLLRGWSLWLFVKCTGEVQDFPAWRSLGALLLSGLVIVVVLVLLMVGIYVLAR